MAIKGGADIEWAGEKNKKKSTLWQARKSRKRNGKMKDDENIDGKAMRAQYKNDDAFYTQHGYGFIMRLIIVRVVFARTMYVIHSKVNSIDAQKIIQFLVFFFLPELNIVAATFAAAVAIAFIRSVTRKSAT